MARVFMAAGLRKGVAGITAGDAFKFQVECTNDAQNTAVVLAKAGTHTLRHQ
jgi:hypothetical protein